MQRIFVLGLGVFLFSACDVSQGSQLAQVQGPVPGAVRVVDYVYNGNGCPKDSDVKVELVNSRDLLITVDDLRAEIGAQVDRYDQRAYCQIAFNLSHVPGWQYAVGGAKLQGHVTRIAVDEASIGLSDYIQGEGKTSRVSSDMTLVDAGYFQQRLSLPAEELNWSECDATRARNIKLESRLSGAETRRYGLLELDGTQAIKLRWRPCQN